MCKTNFSFTLRTARSPREVLHDKIKHRDFNLRHVEMPTFDKLAGISPFRALLNDIARRNWDLRHVRVPKKPTSAATLAAMQLPRSLVEEAMWVRIHYGPTALEVPSLAPAYVPCGSYSAHTRARSFAARSRQAPSVYAQRA